jgi:hypothetical protein
MPVMLAPEDFARGLLRPMEPGNTGRDRLRRPISKANLLMHRRRVSFIVH